MRNDPVFQFKSGISRVVCRTLVLVAVFIHPGRDMGSAEARNGFYFAKYLIQNITPVAQHVHNNAPVVFFTVVPGRALCGDVIPLKHPVPKLAAHREDFAKKTLLNQAFYFHDAWKP